MDDLSSVFERIISSKEEMIDFMERIISISAVGPLSGGDGEKEKFDLIESYLSKWGFYDVKHHDAQDDKVSSGIRPNIEITLKGKDSSRRIVLMAHVDVVPAGDRKLWSGDPFTMRRDGDRLIGRGVEDNGQALVASLFALKTIKDIGLEPIHDVVLFLVSDEEETNDKGIGHLLEKGLFRKDDLILVPDHGDPEGRVIELCEKSLLWVKFTVKGKQCHASMPGLGINALRASMRLGVELDRVLHSTFNIKDPGFDHPVSSFEPTKKGPGVEGINVLPGEDVFYMDCRMLPGYTVEDVLSVMRETADRIEEETGTEILIEKEFSETTEFPTSKDSNIFKALSRAIRTTTGTEPIGGGIGGGTCAALLRNNGFEVAVWETIHNRAHSSDEYILVENLLTDCKVFSAFFLGA